MTKGLLELDRAIPVPGQTQHWEGSRCKNALQQGVDIYKAPFGNHLVASNSSGRLS